MILQKEGIHFAEGIIDDRPPITSSWHGIIDDRPPITSSWNGIIDDRPPITSSLYGKKRPGSFPAAYSTIWTILWGKLNLNSAPTR